MNEIPHFLLLFFLFFLFFVFFWGVGGWEGGGCAFFCFCFFISFYLPRRDNFTVEYSRTSMAQTPTAHLPRLF